MIINIFTFNGSVTEDFEILSDTVNIFLNTDNNQLTALKDNEGTTRLTYEDFIPDLEIGTEIYSFDNIIVTFFNFYPFAQITVTTPPPPITPTIDITLISKTDQTIVNVANGEIVVSATGATVIEYSINNIDFQSSGKFSGLLPGNYIIYARDASNISIYNTLSVTILSAPLPPDPPATPPTKDAIANSDAEIEIQNAYKRVRVLSLFGNAPSLISNGDFETYDGQNWQFWVKYGGINVSRFQRSVLNSNGVATLLQNYAIQFNEKAVDTKFVRHSDIAVQQGDTMKVSYRVGTTPNTGTTRGVYQLGQYSIPATYNSFYVSKLRIRNGNKYLFNADYGNSYQWVNQVATVSHRIDNPQGDLSNYIISFNIPEMPLTGALVIEIYGFAKVQTITTDEFKVALSTLPPQFFSNELSEYSPIALDDFSGVKSSQNGDNDNNGILSISDNLRSFSESPDTLELLFGDYYYRQGKQEPLDNLYAIKYNGIYTTGWSEFTGGSSKPVAFGLGLAKSILTAYQKPFRKWSGALTLVDNKTAFSYLDIFSFIIKGNPSFNRKQFTINGCEIDLKSNQLNNAILVEIFDRAVKSNDISVPSYPDMPDPVFVQDPNAVTNNGIFTEEFTQEFI